MSWRISFVFLTILLIAPLLAPYDPLATDPNAAFRPPGVTHWLGTDQFGRDVLSRTLHGGQRTLLMAVCAAGLASLMGSVLGLIAARADLLGSAGDLLLRACFAMPGLLLALVIVALFGGGAGQVALAVGISQIAPTARLVQTAARVAAVQPHIEAARALGATEFRVSLGHILPNIAGQVGAAALLAFSFSLLNGAALSFLGLAGSPSVPDWGTMLYDGRQAFRLAPWIGLAPGVLITVLVWTASRLSAGSRTPR